MPKRSCSVAGCSRPHYGKSYCQLHYSRVRFAGRPGPAVVIRQSPSGSCSVAGCDRSATVKGFCRGHYQRVHRTGTPGLADLSAAVAGSNDCFVDGCVRVATRKGYCSGHYRRWRCSGETGPAEIQATTVGDDANYDTVHARLRAIHGAANQLSCEHCGRGAEDWAYDYNDPAEKWDAVRGMLYSVDLTRYLALCKRCHVRMDRGKSLAAKVPPDQWPVIRAWARKTGWIVSIRGRLSRKVIVAYMEANFPTWA